jgi:hypothetical protein
LSSVSSRAERERFQKLEQTLSAADPVENSLRGDVARQVQNHNCKRRLFQVLNHSLKIFTSGNGLAVRAM